jgi:fumarate reductase subunit C
LNTKTEQVPLRAKPIPQGRRPASYVVDPTAARRQVWYELASGLTGLALALFMWGHMILVGAILTGEKGFDWLAGMLEEYFIAQPTVAAVLLLFVVHAVMAARKVPAQLKERKMIAKLGKDLNTFGKGFPGNARGDERFRPHVESLLWIWQVRTGMIILVLASFHLLLLGSDVFRATMQGGVGIEAVRSMARVQGGLWLVYAVLLLCVEFHASVGLYRLAVKWGFGSRLGRHTLHRIEQVLLWLILGLGIVVLAVLAGVLAPPLEFLLQG